MDKFATLTILVETLLHGKVTSQLLANLSTELFRHTLVVLYKIWHVTLFVMITTEKFQL